ncbi:MAG TPA: hypothetical protein VFS08_09130 [Gemmatimonadaceae bacterium]|nr:hypothetical protein [Gemmatimonadaceae bacterium]
MLAVPAALVVAACGREPAVDQALSADLQRDLDLAKATSVELASAASRTPAVVSAVESAPAGRARTGDRAPKPAPRRQAPPAPAPVAEPTPDVGETPIASDAEEVTATTGEELAPAPEAAAPEIAETPAASPEPEVVSGPQVTPEGVGSGRPRDPGGWGDIGVGGGGVVLRGGGIGDDDHCEIRPPGGVRLPGGIFGSPRGRPVYGGFPIPGGNASGRTGGGVHTRGGSTIRGTGSEPRVTIGGGSPRSSSSGRVSGGGARRRP